ncbi:hypothetical protein [Endozoicomonas sp. Mp262]|uniref:hypothetical protein n=1 Tax=Endozoicomonas sp. Mp262 TaxID=2919499 RepID=UPI0021D842FE
MSVRIRAQLEGGAFKGISYAMQASYFVRIGIFLYNGLIGIVIDLDSNSLPFLFSCAFFGNIIFLAGLYFENNTVRAKKVRASFANAKKEKSVLGFDTWFLYLAQFFFQAAWLAPLFANNISVGMKGTALAMGSFINGFSGFINAFRLEPILRNCSDDKEKLYFLYEEVRAVKKNIAYFSILLSSCLYIVYIF